MNSPAQSIAYSLWLRSRWALTGIVIYVLVEAVAIQLSRDAAPQILTSSLLLLYAWAYLLNVFCYGPVDMGARGSSFPSHMFVLPMTARGLLGWPMLYGCAVAAGIWLMLARLVLIPGGIASPVIWPATILAATTAWVQAISWSPFPSPFARVPALAIAVTPLGALGLWAGVSSNDSLAPMVAAAGGIGWALAAYAFGLNGLARSRAGSDGDWFRSISDRFANKIRGRLIFARSAIRPPFRSAAAAQLWHEWRRNGRFLPIMLAMIGLPLLGILCISMRDPSENRGLMIGSVHVTPAILNLGLWIFLPMLLSIVSQGFGKFDAWGKERMLSFFATRPMTTAQFIVVKLKATALCALACSGLSMLFFVVWAALEASPWNPHPSVIRGALSQATPRAYAVVLLVVIGLLLSIWRNLAVGMWPALTGRKWVHTVLALVSFAIFMMTVSAGGWIYNHDDVYRRIAPFLPWALGGLVIVKLAVGATLWLRVQRLGLAHARTLGWILAGWILVAACLFTIIGCFIPKTFLLVAGVILITPFARVAVAPLALRANRHR